MSFFYRIIHTKNISYIYIYILCKILIHIKISRNIIFNIDFTKCKSQHYIQIILFCCRNTQALKLISSIRFSQNIFVLVR